MQRNPRSLILFLVLYAIMLGFWFSTFRPKNQPEMPKTQAVATLRGQAQQLEAEAIRLRDTERKLEDARRKFREAIQRYDQISRVAPQSDAGIDARVQSARLHDQMHEYDQAEQVYKDLAKRFPHRTAVLTLDGKPTRVEVGQWAGEKVLAVAKSRADANRNDIRYRLLDLLVAITGRIPNFSYWFALLLMTVMVKAVLYPFTKKQFQSMQDMARVAPLIKEVQEKMKGRPAEEIHRRTMAIYKENNVNIAGGCAPAVVQMMVLIPLYQMIRFYEYEFRKGTFLWIGSALSHLYPQYLARNLSEFDVPLCVLYIISFYLTSKITPMSMSADPAQQQQQKMMSIMMPLMFGYFMFVWRWPAAFTFYWLVLNIISTAQQYRIIKQYAVAKPAGGGSRPRAASSGTEKNSRSSLEKGGSGPNGATPDGANGRGNGADVKLTGGSARSGGRKPNGGARGRKRGR